MNVNFQDPEYRRRRGWKDKPMTTATQTQTECDRSIEQLRTWLSAHTPRETWTLGQYQAYDDRLQALAGWLAKSQLLERSH